MRLLKISVIVQLHWHVISFALTIQQKATRFAKHKFLAPLCKGSWLAARFACFKHCHSLRQRQHPNYIYPICRQDWGIACYRSFCFHKLFLQLVYFVAAQHITDKGKLALVFYKVADVAFEYFKRTSFHVISLRFAVFLILAQYLCDVKKAS